MKTQYLHIPDAAKTGWPVHPEMLVKTACQFCAEISLQSRDTYVNAKSLLGVLAFAPECGKTLLVTADGHDEESALKAVCDCFCLSGIVSKIDLKSKNTSPQHSN